MIDILKSSDVVGWWWSWVVELVVYVDVFT